ncbi:hypothetical protein [Streptomyces sp. YIM 121038]|uniref:hypothetical protein n=1 Tax=Streptomyces sp. YIM 121038 TaxID=2136401 RepID=UPI001110B01B|nr:hypothetical protein [Streptomyces sp. YIM 121038]
MKIKYALAAAGVTAAVSIVPLVAAAPASAKAWDCMSYLDHKGYKVGTKVRSACTTGASSNPVHHGQCALILTVAGVKSAHGTEACILARRGV